MLYDIHTKFYTDWFSHSEVNKGNRHTHRQEGSYKHTFYFFKIRKER
jgi:hypothetical protein